jgi:hypothetical protein
MQRVGLATVLAASFAAILTFACMTDYQRGVDDPNFGGPNALAGQKQPGASSEVLPTGEGGSGANAPVCVTNGGTLIADAGSCTVTFSKDVLPALTGGTCASPVCHGGDSPPNPPRIDPKATTAEMYATFAAFKMSAGNVPYINPCDKDKTKSGIACNLYAVGTCGVKMPQGGPQMDQAVIDKIDAWLQCGSPNN